MKREMSAVLACALVLVASGPSAAMGPVEAGVKGGVNFANQSTDPSDAELQDSRMGLALGGFVGIPVMPSVKIQPEALFMMKGDEEEADGATGSYKLSYIEVPVLAKIGFLSQSPAHPSLFVGPSFGINTGATAEGESGGLSFEADVKDQTKPVDVGVVVGGGVDFQNFGVDVRYTRGISNVIDVEGSDVEANNSVISLMGSLRFL
jgi:hypothetical protein